MEIEDLIMNIKETIKSGEYSTIYDYDYNTNIFFHRTEDSPLYKYIYDQFQIPEDKQKYVRIYIIEGFDELQICYWKDLNLNQIPKMEFEAYISNDSYYENELTIHICLKNHTSEIGMMTDEKPYTLTSKDHYEEVFLKGKHIELVKTNKVLMDAHNDILFIDCETNQNPEAFQTHKFIVQTNEEYDFMSIEAITSLGEKSEIYKITIQDYSQHYELGRVYLEEQNNNVLVLRISGKWYGLVINPRTDDTFYQQYKFCTHR